MQTKGVRSGFCLHKDGELLLPKLLAGPVKERMDLADQPTAEEENRLFEEIKDFKPAILGRKGELRIKKREK